MKTLHLIYTKDTNSDTLDLLGKSATKRGIIVRHIVTRDFDFSQPARLSHSDGLYRVSDSPLAFLIEKYLLNDKVRTFYSDYRTGVSDIDNVIEATLLHQKQGIPIIPSIVALSHDKAVLKRYAEALGGFPLIIKATGGQHGVGVMRVDSLESLNSLADYLIHQREGFMLRQYIDYQAHARLIVLGDKVIDSIEYKRLPDDFRSNAGESLDVVPRRFNEKIDAIAVQSVRSLGYDFGGADILIDEEGTPYLAEVNFPCYFPRAHHVTGTDISGLMIEHLLQKS